MTTAEDVLNRARAHIGYREGAGNRTPFGKWYGMDGQPWCAMFISQMFYEAGLPLAATTSKGFAYCPSGVQWFKRNGRWKTGDPRVGDVVFYQWPGQKVAAHIGIVEAVRPDGSIVAIEGNTNAQGSAEGLFVMRQVRRSSILGYGVPPYAPAPSATDHAPKINGEVVALIDTPDGGGYWAVASDGGVFTFGNAQFYGSMGGAVMNAQIIDAEATPSGGGYWLLGADGGIFSFGDAKFFGSTGGMKLQAPVRSIRALRNGEGYRLVAADGGVFCFGAAPFLGSLA